MNNKVGQYLKKGDSAGNFAPHVTVWTEYGVRSMLLALLKNKEDELERTREACRNLLESRLETLRAENALALAAFRELMDYRNRNTLNFQLEKLDDYLRELGEALGDETR